MRGFFTLLVVIGVLFFGGRELADRYAHGDSWRTADGTTECRTKLGGTIQYRPVVVATAGATGPQDPEWKGAADQEQIKQACESTKPG